MAAPDIVVTGIGACSPLGTNAAETWTALLAGESGARTLEFPWVEELGLSSHFAATAKVEPTEVLDRIEAKRLDRGAQVALIAAREAWADAGSPEVDPTRLGVDWATGIGGVWTLHRRVPWRTALAAVLGGILMGIGARLANGCNIGAYLAGVASGSLSGWVWGLAALGGTWVGLRLRPVFGLGVPRATDSVC